ncbi:uncharacterized protein FA14DRAFT_160798 [Meira miltonrushii]|uniref:Uncharacterized protein n=1 Tax=Meira miltonrushii TaxID=1280837 RepID=A0A316VER4_9BASI|nr:uncharacterized protein FA14DRAFT_160798 [Meira miltonrushii]PWN35794.1 hypothetical protein FA14DRAFT_160798 [Meira miltonrushii]
MAPSAGGKASNGRGRKTLSREARFKKIKAAEAAARTSNAIKNGGNVSLDKGKGKAKKRDDDIEEDPHPFRYKSFNDRLASVHINVATNLGRSGTGALAGLDGHGLASTSHKMQDGSDDESEEDDDMEGNVALHAKTSFGIALQTWKELNLSLPFTSLANRIQSQSLSLPLLLHNQKTITKHLHDTLFDAYPDSYLAYEPALDLIPRLANDLGSAFLPSYVDLLTAILRITTIDKLSTEGQEYTAAMIVERSFESMAATLRCMAPFVLREQQSKEGDSKDWLEITWHLVRPFLGFQDSWKTQSATGEDSMEVDGEAVPTQAPIPKRKKIPMHTRRFVSEAIAHLVRRAKANQLHRVAQVMMEDVTLAMQAGDGQSSTKQSPIRGFASGVAGIWAEVAKSVEGRIHSMAPTHLQAALLTPVTVSSSGEDSSAHRARILVGVYLITSLCHHAQGAELAPIFEWLSRSLDSELNKLESKTIEDSDKVVLASNVHQNVEWMIAYIGTRKGKRVNDESKSNIFGMILRLAKLTTTLDREDAPQKALLASLVQLISIAFPIARIQDLIGNGLKIMDALATHSGEDLIPSAYSAVVSSLASLEFSGYQQVVMPSVLRVTSDLLAGSTTGFSDAVQLLANLDEQGILDTVTRQAPTAMTTRWQNVLANAVQKAISDVTGIVSSQPVFDADLLSSEQIACISLAGVIPSSSTNSTIDQLCALLSTLAKFNVQEEKNAKGVVNSNSVISLVLHSLSRLVDQHGKKVAVHAVASLTQACSMEELLIHRAQHRSVVIRTAQLIKGVKDQGANIKFSDLNKLATALEFSASSADETLRMATLQILSLASFDEVDPSTPSVFAQLTEVEGKGLAVDTVRERNVLLRSIGRNLSRLQVATTEETKPKWFTSSTIRFTIRMMVSTMKLNLRPLWEEARKGLVDLSVQFGQDVWAVAFEELTKTNLPSDDDSRKTLDHDGGSKWISLSDELGYDDESVDKHFQDPQLSSRRDIVTSAAQDVVAGYCVEKQLKNDEAPHGRLDLINYQVQILALFTSLASMAERNNAPLMQHFFRTIVDRPELELNDDESDAEDEIETEKDEEADQTGDVNKSLQAKESLVTLTRNQRRDQLCAYLETFAQFSNPKALYRSADVYAYLLKLCTQGDPKIQRLALNVILQWKDPAHTANADLLRNLLNPSQFREQLTSVVLANTAESTIQPGHRAGLLPLLLRIMYGLIISKSSRISGQANRRSAILTTLADLEPQDLKPFIEVMLEPFDDICGTDGDRAFVMKDRAPLAPQRVQSGYIALLEDVLKYLGLRIIPFWQDLIGVLLNITHHASLIAAEQGPGKSSQIERNIRQSGLRRLNDFFRQPTNEFDWQPFLPAIFKHLITPRLATLRSESIQSPSVVLEIIHTWSGKRSSIMNLVQYDSSLLPNTTSCLEANGVKPSVIIRVLDVLDNIVTYGEDEGEDETDADQEEPSALTVRERIVLPYVSTMLKGVDALIRRCEAATPTEAKSLGRDEMLRRLLDLLSRMASYVTKPDDITSLFSLLGPLLRKNNVIISEKSKADVLIVLEKLMPMWLTEQSATKDNVYALYSIFSALFSKLRGRISRSTLVRAFSQFSKFDESLAQVIAWTGDLNAFDQKRMQEYDFDRRLGAFDTINAEDEAGKQMRARLSPLHWSPLLHNFMYFIQDPDELAVRASSGTAIRRFIDTYQFHLEREQGSSTHDHNALLNDLQKLFTGVVFLGLRRSLRAQSDLVRREAVETIGYAVAHLSPHLSYVSEMKGLLFEGDEEANFFNNIEHIQVHRRLRALTRLGQEALLGHIKSRTILDVFMPLVEHFLLTEHNHGDGNLIQKAVEVLGQLTSQLKWGPYNVLLWKYLSYQSTKSDKGGKEDDSKAKEKVTEKVAVRAAMCVLDNFHFDMDEDVIGANQEEKEVDGEGDPEEELQERDEEQEVLRSEAMAHSRKVLDAVRNRLLPRLIECLDLKDEMEDTVRLPIAIGIARIVLLLPPQYRRSEVLRMLNRMSHVFRSKAQDTRDLARSTLAKVSVTLGPTYFRDLVIELRKVLTRGPQIAVLAFTVHNVLLHCVESEDQKLSILDEQTTGDVVEVIIEDIFGRTAEDRQSIENRTTYKEVKATKSLDTLEQVARIVAPSAIRAMLLPLKELMAQTEAAQATRNFDDCLRRIAVGLQANSHLDAHAYLVLCHELVSASSGSLFKKNSNGSSSKRDGKKSKQMRRTSAILSKRLDVEKDADVRDHFAKNAHRFVAFGLDLLSSAMRKGKFDFNDVSVLAKLEPLLGAVGNSLYASQTNIIIQGIRCLTLLIRCPLQAMKNSLPTIVKQTMKLVQREGNTRSDTLMACLKLLTVIIRDAGQKDGADPDQLLSEQQLTTLCHLIEMHVEEDVEMQGTLFSLLRALIVRKLTVPELYDLMDKVARMLVVQQSESVRSTCRAAFLDFMLNLPQGKKRFSNQIHFLVKNLEYVYESGRLSVLDFLRSMLDKTSDEVLRPYLDLMFVALVMRLANDDSSACREKSALLIRKIVDVSGQEEIGKLIALTQSWSQSTLESETGRNLSRVSMLVFGIMLDAKVQISHDDANAKDWQINALSRSFDVLEQCAVYLEEKEIDVEEETWMEEDNDLLSDWQIPYQSLQLVNRIFKQRDEIWSDGEEAKSQFDSVWSTVARLLLFPHAWVRSASCRLIGEYFGTQKPYTPKSQDELTDLVDMSKKMSLVLRSPQIDEQLSIQVVKNLVFIAKCFVGVDNENITKSSSKGRDKADGEEELVESDIDEDDLAEGSAPKPVKKRNEDEDDALWHKQPLRWLFNRLSHQLRRSGADRAHISSGAMCASSAILKWMAAIMSQLDVDTSKRYLVHVVAPIYRILESNITVPSLSDANGRKPSKFGDIAAAERRSSLETLAREVQELLQAKVGTQLFAYTYASVKRKANDKRHQRRAQAIQRGIDFPEEMEARKTQRNMRKHESRKRKNDSYAKGKDRVRPSKRQR